MTIKHDKQNISEEETEQMVQENYPKIYAYIYRRTLDIALTKDLTQETFYHFFANIHKYDHRGKLLNYLYRIAAHLIMDYAKSNATKNMEYIEEYHVDVTKDSKAQLQRKEEQIILRKWILELPYLLQEAIILRYDEGLKFKDIADITGTNVSTMKSRVKQAVELLEHKARREGWK